MEKMSKEICPKCKKENNIIKEEINGEISYYCSVCHKLLRTESKLKIAENFLPNGNMLLE